MSVEHTRDVPLYTRYGLTIHNNEGKDTRQLKEVVRSPDTCSDHTGPSYCVSVQLRPTGVYARNRR